jgi:potassium-transporting ATPase KdpC subunit
MKFLVRALSIFVILSVGCGLIYPVVVTGLSRLLFPNQANGSMISTGGRVAGSRLVGQTFSGLQYFHGRPSALEKPYDAGTSGGSNFGPSNKLYLEQVAGRIDRVRRENVLAPDTAVPADLVLASGSGLDPHISVQSALIQAPRVAGQRGLSRDDVKHVIEKMTEGQYSGHPVVNVLGLNMALDAMQKK